MLALGLLALVPLLMWLTQTVLLRRAGLRPRLRISPSELPSALKRANRLATKLIFGGVLLAYPLLRGAHPLSYYAAFLPVDRPLWRGGPAAAAWGAAAAVLYLALLYLAWLGSGNIRFQVRHGRARLARREAGVVLTALMIAAVEELLFRAMLLHELLETLPTAAAIALGALLFAAAHYVRSVKRYWTFPGHVLLGLLFCVAFWQTGTLWLSFGLHAGGVWVLMAVRPLIRYTGPPWLVGASIFPYAGVVGLAALAATITNVWLAFSTR